MSRIYDIELSCGCMISFDGGGGCMPCSYDGNSNCKYFEEFLCSPRYVEWSVEMWRRNCLKEPSKSALKMVEQSFKKLYKERLKELKK